MARNYCPMLWNLLAVSFLLMTANGSANACLFLLTPLSFLCGVSSPPPPSKPNHNVFPIPFPTIIPGSPPAPTTSPPRSSSWFSLPFSFKPAAAGTQSQFSITIGDVRPPPIPPRRARPAAAPRN